ncbi:MAG: FAD:protein FMN transferase [Clostridiaceae bacterium]|nr:FAD:protein FMN transferase [Clostridiaceae bacterium]
MRADPKNLPKRRVVLCFLLAVFLILPALSAGCRKEPEKYTYSFTGCFDTVIQIIGYDTSEEAFSRLAQLAQSRFTELHRLFDIYHAYDGMNNIYTINQQAGIAPVVVDDRIISLLQFYQEKDALAPGVVNAALGPVLEIWRQYRSAALDNGQAAIPAPEELQQASRFCDARKIIIDPEQQTVYLQDSGMMLDVGAVAKGYATELVAQDLIAAGMTSGIISAGGSNVRLIGAPADGRQTWQVGLQNPDGNLLDPDDQPLEIILANNQSIVTSGDYQRYYEFNGQVYHHLIDSKTLQPARYFRAVTIMTPDSGLADYLSTAVFLLPYDDGRRLIESLPDCEALWIFADGHTEATAGMTSVLQSAQGSISSSTTVSLSSGNG